MRRFALALVLCSFIGCGKEPGDGNGPDGGNGSADAPMLEGEKFSLKWGPITVPPNTESTQCVWLRLGNATEIKVRQMHNQLNSASHHLIVYKDDQDTTEQLTPTPCDPFTGALNTTGMIAPIAITQKADDVIVLPERVAYTFAPNQMIKLEMHYLNASDEAREVEATADFYAADPATIDHEAGILFAGSPDIDLAPGETETLHQFLTIPASIDFSQSKFFAVTGHTHKLGTSVKVRVGPNKNGPMTEVYAPDPFKWDEPETTTYNDNPFSVPAGGGFDFECTWRNTTSMTVEFGESANAEMCFFWAYYYPSQGSKVCIHTDNFGGQDICCPGNSLCSLIEDQF